MHLLGMLWYASCSSLAAHNLQSLCATLNQSMCPHHWSIRRTNMCSGNECRVHSTSGSVLSVRLDRAVLLASVDRASVPLAHRTEGQRQRTPRWVAVEGTTAPIVLPFHCVGEPARQQQLRCWELLVLLPVGWIGIG